VSCNGNTVTYGVALLTAGPDNHCATMLMRLIVLYIACLSISSLSFTIQSDRGNRFKALFDSAINSLSVGDYEASARYLKSAVQIDPTHANSLQILGMVILCSINFPF